MVHISQWLIVEITGIRSVQQCMMIVDCEAVKLNNWKHAATCLIKI